MCMKSNTPSPVKAIMNLTTSCSRTVFNPTTEILALASDMAEKGVKLVRMCVCVCARVCVCHSVCVCINYWAFILSDSVLAIWSACQKYMYMYQTPCVKCPRWIYNIAWHLLLFFFFFFKSDSVLAIWSTHHKYQKQCEKCLRWLWNCRKFATFDFHKNTRRS